MTRTWWKQSAKPFFGIIAGIAALSAAEAQALQVASGDLVLALYGNGQEYYRDLGQASSIRSSGNQLSVNMNSPLNPLSATTGSEPVLWTLLSGQGTTQLTTFINTASQFTAAETIASGSNNGVAAANSSITGWRNALNTTTGPGTELVLAASDPASFTTAFTIGGNLNGNFTGGGLAGPVGSLLNIIQGQARTATGDTNVLTDIGRAVLGANGQLQICGGGGCGIAAVPLPAAVVLFGSGLIGLAGIARRRRGKTSA